MQPEREAIRPDPGSSFFCFRRRRQRFPFEWHFHEEIELTLIVRGRGQRFVGDHIAPYREGDLVLLGGNLPHTYRSEGPGPHEAVVLQITEDFLGPGFMEKPEMRPVGHLLRRAGRGLRFPEEHAAQIAPCLQRLPEETPTPRLLHLLEALAALANSPDPQPLATPGYRPALGDADHERLARVLGHLQDRVRAPPSQREAATLLHMSPASFARFFRRTTGRTYGTYLLELRLGEACRLLAETPRPIGEIADACGFVSQPHFSRRFKALYGMTPRAYRRQWGEM